MPTAPNLATWQRPRSNLPLWLTLLRLAVLPPLLMFMAAAGWQVWVCFQDVIGAEGAIVALATIAGVAALLRQRKGMPFGLALVYVGAAGLVALVWVVVGLVVWALVAG